MTRPEDTGSGETYQDPHGAGSLSAALRAWQALRAAKRLTATTPIRFTLSCWSESRAVRVAAFLRRSRGCAVTQLHQVAGARRDTWHVHGSTHPAIHSLSDLEAVWTWLRSAAKSHQVALVHVTIPQALG